MTNAEAAALLESIGQLLELQGENPFKVRAYLTAARVLEGLEVPFGRLAEEKKLGELPGIGKAIEEKLTELHGCGRLKYYEELKSALPNGLLDLLRVPTLGPKKARVLWKELGITNLEKLEAACKSDKVKGLKGFGEKTQVKFLSGLAHLKSNSGYFLLSAALGVARQLLEPLRSLFHVKQSSWCGSLRRGKPLVRDVDLLAATSKPKDAIDAFVAATAGAEMLGRGDTKCSVRLATGLQVDLRVVAEEEFGSALQYFTGSKEHNVQVRARALKMGLALNEYGLFKGEKRLDCPTEEDIYRRLKLSYIPPELREGRGEVELAEKGELPRLVERDDLQGVFHVHSTWSDGTASIEAMAEKARSMGLKWMGLSDHSGAAAYANGLNEARLRNQMKEVKELNRKLKGFRILHGLEADILPSGKLDLTPELLGELDFVIGSIHSRFDLPEAAQTERICAAFHDPNFSFLGHPTGRLLLEREGYKFDLDVVLQEAAKTGKAVEINANPHRLDLDDAHVRRARELKIPMAINPDAHSTSGLEDIEFGLLTARRGGVTKSDLFNCLPAEKVLDRLGTA